MVKNFFCKKTVMGYAALFILLCLFNSTTLVAGKTPDFKTKRISMISFENAVLLDIAGPLSVFSAANMFISEKYKTDCKAYEIEVLADKKGPVRMLSGMVILADGSFNEAAGDIDTMMIAGGPGIYSAGENQRLIAYLKKMNGEVRRMASICGGAFILAKAGLLKGKKATTHWNSIDELITSYPDVKVQKDIDYIRDGRIYTSGGVMNGVQLALALVEEDYGREISLKVAKLIEVPMNIDSK